MSSATKTSDSKTLGPRARLSPLEQLGVGLLLMAGRFISPVDPPTAVWLLGHLAAGAATGLVLHAMWTTAPRGWFNPVAVTGALLYQLGVLVALGTPMDVRMVPSAAPVLICAGGAALVAIAALGLHRALNRSQLRGAGDRHGDTTGQSHWPRAVAIGALIGFVAVALGVGRLVAFDPASLLEEAVLEGAVSGSDGAELEERLSQMLGDEEMSPIQEMMLQQMLGGGDTNQLRERMMEMMGGGGTAAIQERLAGLVGPDSPVVPLITTLAVLVLVTPLTLAAVGLGARQPQATGLAVGGFTALALLPLAAPGGVGAAVALAGVALLVGVVASRYRAAAHVAIPAVLLPGGAIVAGVQAVPFILALGAYGIVVGGVVLVAAGPQGATKAAPA